MGTANYDSSRRTELKRTQAIYTWNQRNKAAVTAGLSVRREQPDTQMSEVVTYRREVRGNYTPTSGPNVNCPCSQPVFVNAGGNNSANVQ